MTANLFERSVPFDLDLTNSLYGFEAPRPALEIVVYPMHPEGCSSPS